jgi:Ca2+-transporting ATPase
MSSVVLLGDHFRAYVKGAPELVLDFCTHTLHEDSSIHELTPEARNGLLDHVIEMANDAMRTILIAFADLDGLQQSADWDDPRAVETNLTVIGVAGIVDPLRPEVPHSIEMCRRAGVTVRMVTGDYINTAKAVARQCGILTDDGVAITGVDFSTLSKLELLALLPKLQVVARTSPLDKYRLVGLLMEAGEVVAVTGDGTNDAPAMKRAACGLAMGRCGTELAKMASDVVILDDDFSSIVVALKWGRCTYDNVRAFLTYQLTVNVIAMIVSFVGSVAFRTPPLKAIQLLWTNLIVGAAAALALATGRPRDALLTSGPPGASDHLVSRAMVRDIAGQVLYQTSVVLTLLFGHNTIFGFSHHEPAILQNTLVFNTFLLMSYANMVNAKVSGPRERSLEGIFANRVFNVILVAEIALHCVIVELGGEVFHLTPLNWKEWICCVVFAIGAIPVGAALKFVQIKDRIAEELENKRERKKQKMREFYHGMTAEQMWKIERVPHHLPDEYEG